MHPPYCIFIVFSMKVCRTCVKRQSIAEIVFPSHREVSDLMIHSFLHTEVLFRIFLNIRIIQKRLLLDHKTLVIVIQIFQSRLSLVDEMGKFIVLYLTPDSEHKKRHQHPEGKSESDKYPYLRRIKGSERIGNGLGGKHALAL